MALTYIEIRQRSQNTPALITDFNDVHDELLQNSSYDLTAGMIIWKETDGGSKSSIKIINYDKSGSKKQFEQETVTMAPGQVVFVITKEIINIPLDMYATVYARNKYSRDGILALTTGHVDPGVSCPIVIRLINLRSIPFNIQLGSPIYSIVFEKFDRPIPGAKERTITMEETVARTIESANAALDNALFDLSITHKFVRKDEIASLIWGWIKSNALKSIAIFIAIAAGLVTISELWDVIKQNITF